LINPEFFNNTQNKKTLKQNIKFLFFKKNYLMRNKNAIN